MWSQGPGSSANLLAICALAGWCNREKFAVRVTPEERSQLEHMVRAGKDSARVINRARILLKTGDGWPTPNVAQALNVSQGTVFNVKRRFA